MLFNRQGEIQHSKQSFLPYGDIERFSTENVGEKGILIRSDEVELVAGLASFLLDLSLIAIEFLSFNDGRGFTLAKQLRLIGFDGELRATGEVTVDRLAYMAQCGFDSFEIQNADQVTVDKVVRALTMHQVSYQDDSEKPAAYRLRNQVQGGLV